ncbi:MAG: hypothetical protein NTZ33_04795 [Bacteroidetes bacterium]|nr:hypothetical protein [Bacteroidota bacterium]
MKNKFFLRTEFIDWLVNEAKLPLPSANSYCSYVAGADKYTKIYLNESNEGLNLFHLLEFSVTTGDTQDMLNIINTMINFLSLDNINDILDSPLSSINKWKSGLYQYEEFLLFYIDSNIDTVNDNNSSNNAIYSVSPFNNYMVNSIEVLISKIDKADKIPIIKTYKINALKKVYSKQDLYKNFTLRMITQDRHYDNIFYPIGFIKRYFYYTGGKVFFDKWLDSILDEIMIYHEEGEIKLSQISKLEIDKNIVSAHFNNAFKSLLTKESDNKTLTPLTVYELSEIALDHEMPLFNIMNENIDRFVTIKKITNELKKYISGKISSKKLRATYNIALKSSFINEISLNDIKEELLLISSLTKLQLMESSKNSSKGTFYEI